MFHDYLWDFYVFTFLPPPIARKAAGASGRQSARFFFLTFCNNWKVHIWNVKL